MSEEEATLALTIMNKMKDNKCPWSLSFSYGRALQHSCLRAWLGTCRRVASFALACPHRPHPVPRAGKAENIPAAQKVFLNRAKANSEATLGTYNGWAGEGDAGADLTVKNYAY